MKDANLITPWNSAAVYAGRGGAIGLGIVAWIKAGLKKWRGQFAIKESPTGGVEALG
jgi:hypothetical protein